MTKGMRIKGLRLACVKKVTKAGLAASLNDHLSDSVLIFGAHDTLDSNELQTQLAWKKHFSLPVSRIGMCVSSWI